MPRPYHPLAFANEFILKAQPAGVEHMKLQKLVYYSYGWWIAYHEEPILTEPPQVWRYGPVFVSLYLDAEASWPVPDNRAASGSAV